MFTVSAAVVDAKYFMSNDQAPVFEHFQMAVAPSRLLISLPSTAFQTWEGLPSTVVVVIACLESGDSFTASIEQLGPSVTAF